MAVQREQKALGAAWAANPSPNPHPHQAALGAAWSSFFATHELLLLPVTISTAFASDLADPPHGCGAGCGSGGSSTAGRVNASTFELEGEARSYPDRAIDTTLIH